MADDQNFSDEEFGFSDDFEEEVTDDVVEDADEMDFDDPVEASDAAEATSGNTIARYGLIGFGAITVLFGGYQIYQLFSPTRPVSAFDKQHTPSLVTSLSTHSKAPEDSVVPEIPDRPVTKAEPPTTVSVSGAPNDQPASVTPSPSRENETKASLETNAPVPEVVKEAPPNASTPSTPSMALPAEKVASAPVPTTPKAKEVVVRYEIPKAMIGRQNSIESTMKSLQNRFVFLEDSIREQRNKSSAVASDLDGLSRTLQSLNRKIKALDAKMDTVAKTLREKQVAAAKKQRAKLKASPSSVAEKPVAAKPVPVANYFIQAMVPGRAWIKAKKRSTITVRKGSRLHGYGNVTVIDVQNGRILTTSGKVIRFHPEER